MTKVAAAASSFYLRNKKAAGMASGFI